MVHPDKWRETRDPRRLGFHEFQLTRVTGYPHAGNDVFQAEGIYHGRRVEAYIKAARQQGADIRNEVETIQKLGCPLAPEILDYDRENWEFVVTLAMPGERLSALAGDNAGMESMPYLYEYGRTLAKLHRTKGDFSPVKDRRFFHLPERERLAGAGLEDTWRWLSENRPRQERIGFCHGDFHYANLLWEKGRLSAILDFELAGLGDRDFDLAWALICRPGQRFLNTRQEIERFLEGYRSLEACRWENVRYHMALIYTYFYQFSGNPPEYLSYIRRALEEICGE